MSSVGTVLIEHRLPLVRRDSKDSCYSEEMSDAGDLSSTNSNGTMEERLSPLLAPSTNTLSRKSSTGDSAVSMDYIDNNELYNKALKRPDQNTAIVIDKLSLLEQKLKEMESLLKGETEKRLKLEQKVSKLEEENNKLISSRTQAVSQLQSFSEKFFSMPEPPKHISPVGTPPLCSPKLHSPRTLQSPRHSQLELRRISSNSSVGSRLSGHSYTAPPLTSRYSNISL